MLTTNLEWISNNRLRSLPPLRGGAVLRTTSGGIATLNLRLIAGTPAGVLPKTEGRKQIEYELKKAANGTPVCTGGSIPTPPGHKSLCSMALSRPVSGRPAFANLRNRNGLESRELFRRVSVYRI